MPNYNSPFLYNSILSVIEQNYEKWELIIIDNFSNNSPEKIIDKFKDDRIHFHKFNNKNNIARSRNFGIKKAKFDWIAFLDSDDTWKPKKLEKQLFFGMYYLPKKLGFIKKIIKDKSKEMKQPIYETLIKDGNGIANSSAVVRKSLLASVNFLSEDKNKYSWEDYDCWIKCSQKTDIR